MAKKIQNNFTKFIKLASAVKKIADKDSDVLDYIISNTPKKSGSNWNIIQRWTSVNLFPQFKDKPLSKLTAKNIENAINGGTNKAKDSCASVFKVVSGDIVLMEVWDIEQVVMAFEPNLKVQVKLNDFDTGVVKVKELGLGRGEFTTKIREHFDSSSALEGMVSGERMLVKGRVDNYSNCNYFIQFFFEDTQTPEEISRRVNKRVTLSEDENQSRLERKLLAESSRKRKAKKVDARLNIRKTKIPSKTVVDPSDDTIPTAETKTTTTPIAPTVDTDFKTERIKQFRGAVRELKELLKDGLITKKQFSKSFEKLNDNLEKGGVV